MKTSNKILLVFLVTGFGFITTSRLWLYNKYIHHQATPEADFNNYYYSQYNLPAIKHALIENIAECELYQSASSKLMIGKSGARYASYSVHGDTLIVKGNTQEGQDENIKLNRSSQEVNLYLPPGVSIIACRSNISILGNIAQTHSKPYHIALDYSTLNTRVHFFRDTVNRYFDTVYVIAKNKSGIYFSKHDFFNQVYTTLANSEINDGRAVINDFSVSSDSSSVVIATGNNITKLNTAGSNR